MNLAPSIEDLQVRHLQAAAADESRIETRQPIVGVLQGRDRLSALSGATRLLWHGVRDLAREKPTRPIRVLDIATGAGGIPIRLWKLAARSGFKIAIDGCDSNPTSLELARRRAREHGVPVRFFATDPLQGELPDGYDVITSSLYLHHLPDGRALQLLRTLDAAAARRVMLHDHARSAGGIALARLASPLIHGAATRQEAEGAVRSAFTPAEALELARRAGIEGAVAQPRRPCCFVLSWSPGDGVRARTAG